MIHAQFIVTFIYKFNKHNSSMGVEKDHLGTLLLFKNNTKELYGKFICLTLLNVVQSASETEFFCWIVRQLEMTYCL